MNDPAEGRVPWSFDHRAPLALVVTILLHAASALVWAGATSARINELEAQTHEGAAVAERTVRLEEQVRQIGITVDRIETKLDRMAPNTETAAVPRGLP